MNEGLKVPKRPVDLEVLFCNSNEFVPCRVFLSEMSRFQKGQEKLIEFLNTGRWFVPIERGGQINVVNLHFVAAFRAEADVEYTRLRDTRIVLHNEVTFDVAEFEPLPENRSRTIDFLNSEKQFLEFLEDGHILYINKLEIMRVVDI